jgi:MoaA/NifB/PqqE/SkfB family radical SAM enzyme
MAIAYRDFTYPLNVFMHVLTSGGGSVESLHYGLFDSADEPLARAQERSTALLLERLPAPPARLLDVGIGVGSLLSQLTALGYDARGMTPDPQQFAMVRARHGDQVNASCERFENYAASADPSVRAFAFDAVIFQESSQYIDSVALFQKTAALSPRALVIDEFSLRPGKADDGLHSWAGFLDAATAAGFVVAEEIDLSARAAPTVDYFLDRLPRQRETIANDLGLSHQQIDDLIASGHRYRERYRTGVYAYRLLDLRMREIDNGRTRSSLSSRSAPLMLDPFIHAIDGRLEHPLTGRTLIPGDANHAAVSALSAIDTGETTADHVAPTLRDALARDGWLVEPHPDLARRSRLRIVTIETHTACNQACYFCPVSIAPRAAGRMSDALFDDIVRQLTAYSGTLEGVFLSGYNEPTVDPRFVDHCARLIVAGLPVAVNTNATGLTPARVDQLARIGELRLLSVNMSTLDRQRYAHDRGCDHLDIVLRHLDYAGRHPVAREMIIAVLGNGDDQHHADVDALRTRFAGSRFEVRGHEVMDRAGHLPIGLTPPDERRALRGCDNLGSRPLQHLHITAEGRCVFCCEDYDERYVVGDLRAASIAEILRGDELARLRRWSYGLETAPDDFICRRCIFALRR